MARDGCEEVLDDGTRCGWNRHPAGLQWDHRDDKEHGFREAFRPSWAWARILAEVEKCELVCACCHAIRTARRGYLGGTPMHGRERSRVIQGEFGIERAKKSTCRRGHLLDEGGNLRVGADGKRRCRACDALRSARRRSS